MRDYNMPNSYNGWPASENKASINVVQHPVYAGGIKAGDVTTVLQYVSDQLNARVEKIVMGHCWGYAYRANVNNPSSLSCHASGTAIDFNAPAHPNGASNTFSSAQVSTIKTILKEVENSVKWLQGYDEMHFEIGVNASTLAGVASRLKGSGSTTPPPSTPPVEEDMTPYTEAQMKSFAESGARSFAATQEFRDRVMQACNESIKRDDNPKKVVDLLLSKTARVVNVDGNGKETASDTKLPDVWGGTYSTAQRNLYKTK